MLTQMSTRAAMRRDALYQATVAVLATIVIATAITLLSGLSAGTATPAVDVIHQPWFQEFRAGERGAFLEPIDVIHEPWFQEFRAGERGDTSTP